MTRPLWGGEPLPPSACSKHFCAIGATGSGKTLNLLMLMKSVVPDIVELPDQRVLIYDAKQDIVSYLYHMVPPERVKILNPFDRRCCRWNLARDVTSPVTALQLANIIVPEEPNANNRFFSDAARHLLAGVITALIKKAETRNVKWTLRDVILLAREPNRMGKLLRECEQTQDLVVYYEAGEREFGSIMSTIATKLAYYEPIAALWEHAHDEFSLVDWLDPEQDNHVLVLGSDESVRLTIDAVNRAIFKRITELVLAQEESTERRSWFFFDEIREAGNLDGLSRLLTKGRSKGACVALGFQDIEGLREVYGTNVANEIVGQCSTKAILKVSSPETAEWACTLRGSFLDWMPSYKQDITNPERTVTLQERQEIYAREIISLPFPDERRDKMKGYYISDEGLKPREFSPSRFLPVRDPLVRDFWPYEGSREQYLSPWCKDDETRLSGLLVM